jgi:hypothetical protein
VATKSGSEDAVRIGGPNAGWQALMPRRHKIDIPATERAGFQDPDSFVSLDGRLFLAGKDKEAQELAVIMRDNFTCQRCGQVVDPDIQIIDVHHKVKRSQGGSDDLDNLETIHRTCHNLEHPEKRTQFTGEN